MIGDSVLTPELLMWRADAVMPLSGGTCGHGKLFFLIFEAQSLYFNIVLTCGDSSVGYTTINRAETISESDFSKAIETSQFIRCLGHYVEQGACPAR